MSAEEGKFDVMSSSDQIFTCFDEFYAPIHRQFIGSRFHVRSRAHTCVRCERRANRHEQTVTTQGRKA
jgi:hypothetical protein